MELENELGRTDFNTSTICIDKDISVQSVKESTLLHEIIHACLFLTYIALVYILIL